jgi:diguanylate cyclase (GGDEF)-like protein
VTTDEQFSDVLSEFARTMITDFPIQAILDRLVERIVAVMPITAAGVTLIAAEGEPPRYMSASSDAALRFERVQTKLTEGPCLGAYRTNTAIAVPDLRLDERFQAFAPEAISSGLLAVFAFPLRHGDYDAIGALDLYRETPGPLDEQSMHMAQTFADVAASYILNAQARQDLKDASTRFQEMSLHDSLTGLPNRILFGQRVDHAVLRSRRSGGQLAVLYADLDRFKGVNDQYGHQVGDQLLVAVAERLTESLRPGDTLARISGDEFVILCEDLEEAAVVDRLADRIDVGMNQPFVVSGHTLAVSASVGIAYSGPGTEVPGRMLRDADTAMYQAKRNGGGRHQVLDIREQAHAEDQATLSRDLDGVLSRGELAAHYQPIVAAADGRVLGVEALMRWSHPSRGAIPPTLLIPLAEESRMICEIGRWIFRNACEDMSLWNRRVSTPQRLEVATNVSPHELLACDYVAMVAAVLDETRTDPRLVTIEITESVLIKDPARVLLVLSDLKELGLKVALDDFGTGYSSLSYLHDFPVDIVKIDQSFVSALSDDADSHAIVSAIIELAHALRKKVVAEGMETLGQYRSIAALGCEACQGFYFAKPMPAADIAQLLDLGTGERSVRLPVPSTPSIG